MPVIEKDEIRPLLERCENVLRKLIQIDSCQPEGNEATMVKLIQKLIPAGADCQVIEHSKNRASLIVRIVGEEEGGPAFIGHLDTVACNNLKNWKYPPHEGCVENGVLYGRGASDMKGGIAAMILTIQRLAAEQKKPKKTIHFCFTADEENGGIGICSMAEGGYLKGIREVIICEPSGGGIGTCEKGALWLSVSVQGISAHASRPELGSNAVEYAIAFAGKVKQYVSQFEEHEILGAPTASITKLEGGVMTNIIPCDAKMELDIRTVPEISHSMLLGSIRSEAKKMEKEHPGLQLDIQVLNNRPALQTDRESVFTHQIYEAAEHVHISIKPKGLHFYTDYSQLVSYVPIPFVIAGPGEDSAAHTVNESICLDSVVRYTEFYYYYIKKHFM